MEENLLKERRSGFKQYEKEKIKKRKLLGTTSFLRN